MKKQYAIDEFIDLLTQARTHLERGEYAAASLAAQQAELARLTSDADALRKAAAGIEQTYRQKHEALEATHAQAVQQFDSRMAEKQRQIDEAHAERIATHQRIVTDLQAQADQLSATVRTLTAQAGQARANLESVQSVLAKTKAEAGKFSALLS